MIVVHEVKKYFYKKNIFGIKKNIVKAVNNVSFNIDRGTTFGLVGESGSGKTTLAKLLSGILTPDAGVIEIEGEKDVVFQDPFSSLNPRMNIDKIVKEPLLIRKENKSFINSEARNVLKLVKLDYEKVKDKYPHQFSGGERQRIAIARALIHRPDLIILDEPVSSLDVSIQADILNLLKDLQEGKGLTYLFISHDLRVIEFMSDVVGVMRDGKLVEIEPKEEIYKNPKDQYTKHLLDVTPTI